MTSIPYLSLLPFIILLESAAPLVIAVLELSHIHCTIKKSAAS